MVEKDGYMTVELWKNKILIESYSTNNSILFREMVERLSKKIKPDFNADGCENVKYSIHTYTY